MSTIGASVLLRSSSFSPSLTRLRHVRLLLLAAALSAAAATLGVASLALAGYVTGATSAPAWSTWWLGDAMGILVVSALILTWIAEPVALGRVVATQPAWRALEQPRLSRTCPRRTPATAS